MKKVFNNRTKHHFPMLFLGGGRREFTICLSFFFFVALSILVNCPLKSISEWLVQRQDPGTEGRKTSNLELAKNSGALLWATGMLLMKTSHSPSVKPFSLSNNSLLPTWGRFGYKHSPCSLIPPFLFFFSPSQALLSLAFFFFFVSNF